MLDTSLPPLRYLPIRDLILNRLTISYVLLKTGIAKSRSDITRFFKQSTIGLNNKKNKINKDRILTTNDLHPGGNLAKIIIWVGKSNFLAVVFVDAPVPAHKHFNGKRCFRKITNILRAKNTPPNTNLDDMLESDMVSERPLYS